MIAQLLAALALGAWVGCMQPYTRQPGPGVCYAAYVPLVVVGKTPPSGWGMAGHYDRLAE